MRYSFNALFGKLLQRNSEALMIIEVQSNVKINDDNGHETWRTIT